MLTRRIIPCLDVSRGRVVKGVRFEGLRDVEREAIRLRFEEGLTLREMSRRTGAPISTLGERVQAALGKIRRRAGKPGATP